MLLDELEKGHSDVLNILLQIMEDGILTDGKGRTVNFKNCILVMTSNVGSKRILEVADKSMASKVSTAPSTSMTQSTSPNVDPLRPDEVMTRLQKNPDAMAMMMEAASDPDLMRAMQTAMGGSPADLLRLGQQNEKVANFLTRLWTVLNETQGEESLSTNDNYTYPSPTPVPQPPMKENDFASGILKQFQNIFDPKSNESTKNNPAAVIDVAPTSVPAPAVTEVVPQDEASQYAEMSAVVKEELADAMKPELLNRIDEIVIFSPLGGNELKSVASLLLNGTIRRAQEERGITLTASSALIDRVIEEGAANAAKFGARPMRRAVQRYFEDTVSDAIVRGFLNEGDTAFVDISGPLSAVITNNSNMKSMTVEIEDTSAGIGAPMSASSTTRVNGSTVDELETEPVRG